jgi:hypothetical protein
MTVLPAVGTTELQLRLFQIVTDMRADGLPRHWVDKRSPEMRNRGWLTTEKPPGRAVRSVSYGWFTSHIGEVVYELARGVTFEVTDRAGVRCYADWCPPDDVARLGEALQHVVRRRDGTEVRTRLRDIMPTELAART